MCLSPNPEAGPFSCSRQREKGKGESWREDEWRESSGGMESKGICNANSCPATLNNSKCWMEILLFWSLVINFCRSGPFSFGLFWPAHLPFCTPPPPPPPPPTTRSHPLLQYFCSCPLYLFVFRNHFLPLLIHRNSARLLPSRFPLRSSSLISLAASFLPNCLKRIARRRKEAPLCFMALISLYSWSVDYTLPAAMGDTDGEPLWGPLSKLFLLKERRERIISHLLNIRFIHNAPGVFIEWELLLLLIAAMVAAVELVSCARPLLSLHLTPRSSLIFETDVIMHFDCLCHRRAEKFYFYVLLLFIFLPLMCCFPCPSAASSPIELRGSLIYYLMD